jgi:hypothetical protein
MDIKINDIAEKYNYNTKLSAIIEALNEYAIEYYGRGSEDIINQAIIQNRIYIVNGSEKMGTALNNIRSKNIIQTGAVLSEDTINQTVAVRYSEPIIEKKKNRYTLTGANSFILLNEAKTEATSSLLGAAAHELFGHAVKSIVDEYTINGDIITRRSGLCIEEGKIMEKEDNSIEINWYKCINLGLEEASTTYFEVSAVEALTFDSKYKNENIKDSKCLYDIICQLFEDEKLQKEILNAQISNQTLNIKDLSLWQSLNENLNMLLNMIYNYNINEIDKVKANIANIISLYKEQIMNPLT